MVFLPRIDLFSKSGVNGNIIFNNIICTFGIQGSPQRIRLCKFWFFLLGHCK